MICLSVCLSLVCGSVQPVLAASSPKLSSKKLSMKTGKSKKLKLTGVTKKVKWTIVDQKISGKSVSAKKHTFVLKNGTKVKSGLITLKASGKYCQNVTLKAAKKKGVCYIKAKVGGKTHKCKITIKKSGFIEKTLSKSAVCQTGQFKAKTTKKRNADSTFVNAMSDTSVKLLQKVMKAGAGDNILISPDSILTALSMVENGAGGATLRQFKKALGGISAGKYSQYLSTLNRRLSKSKQVTYQIANSIWYKKNSINLKKKYLQKIVNYYNAEVYAAPFSSKTVKDINKWCYNHTKGKIPSIIDRITPDMETAILNAVYFKGAWAEPYVDTVKRDFTKEDGSKKKVSMLEGRETTYLEVNGGEGFVKPYQGGDFAFMGILPPENTTVDAFAAELKGTDLVKAYRKRLDANVIVRTRMPEFKYDYTIPLKTPLNRMGIRDAFTSAADFSGMSKKRMCIDQILHKTYIDLNKEGTEAAAVTAVMMKSSSIKPIAPPVEKTVYLDRPFLYGIIDTDTGIPLFLGVIHKI